jgi:mannose-1-phosphate guanylyltransferase
MLVESDNCLVASADPQHLIATIGCRDLVVIHTGNATLICAAAMAERIKDLQKAVGEQFGAEYT